jgi:hypothetical protein
MPRYDAKQVHMRIGHLEIDLGDVKAYGRRSPVVVVVTGGRYFEPRDGDAQWLLAQLEEAKRRDPQGLVELRHGGCRGFDRWAGEIARVWGAKVVEFIPDWKRHGASAGPRRNREMMVDADLVLAFAGGLGTADCVRAAGNAGVKVIRRPARAPLSRPA